MVAQKEQNTVVICSCWKDLHAIDHRKVQEENLNIFPCWVGLQQVIAWGFVEDGVISLNFPNFDGAIFAGGQYNVITEVNNICDRALMSLTDWNCEAC